MTESFVEKVDQVAIVKNGDDETISVDHYSLLSRLTIEEVREIFICLMARQTDKSEETQCRCAIIANITHHRSSRRRHGSKTRSNLGLVRRLMHLNAAWAGNGQPEIPFRFHYVSPTVGSCYNACEPLITAARLAFEFRLEDPVLEELFRDLYECNGSFAELLYNQRDEESDDNADVEYFLEQATRMKLLFPVDNKMMPMLECPLNRMYSMFRPIEGAIDNERYDDLKLMVRYGASLDYDTAFGDPISVAQQALNLVFRCYNPEEDDFYQNSKLPSYLGFLQVVLRAIPRVVYPPLQRFRDESLFATDGAVNKQKRAMFCKLRRDGFISAGLAGEAPPPLQHLCRLVVRRRLHLAWSLPTGIYALALPPALHKYLDLQDD